MQKGNRSGKNRKNISRIDYGKLTGPWREAYDKLRQVRGCDYHSLKREFDRAAASAGQSYPEESEILKITAHKISRSVEEKQRRQLRKFRYNWNESLPITERKDEIIQTIRDNQVVVLAGETGSGKTTQIPKFCLAAGRGINGKIGCTQPRRIAALSVAERIAEEMGEKPGKTVGYKIRFQDKDDPLGFIKIMTDGILLAETQGDHWLNEYDTLIIDEAHERSLNIDFILGILRNLIRKRKDLKIIITSATIDTKKFSEAFDNAPVIEVSGRTFPVEVRYREDDEDEETSLAERACEAAEELIKSDPKGDILIFMPAEQEIRDACDILSGRHKQALVLPLYARLSSSDQQRVFQHSSQRKIIVSTNVAETSLTIPGIKYVIDSGMARVAQYYPNTGTFALPIVPVSRSSADQRKGRCGRIENGICVRLYSEENYLSRQEFTPAEVLRTNLAEVILRMLSLRLDDPSRFPFIDAPSSAGIADGYKTLLELGAVEQTGKGKSRHYRLTGIGRTMAYLPLDPRLARMILQADEEQCLEDVLIIAASLNVHDPRERPSEKAGTADQAHAKFRHEESDFLTRLNIWRYYGAHYETGKTSQLRKFCKENYISFRRMREWQDIYRQIRLQLEEKGYKVRPYQGNTENFYPAVHRAILSGFLSHIALKKEKVFYRATKNREMMIFPGSGLFQGKRGGEWIVAGEIVKTSRLFARIVANIDSAWLLDLGSHLMTSTYHAPVWSQDQGQVTAVEQKRLFGFIVAEGSVPYGPVNPDEATDIFIRSCLIEGMVKDPSEYPFLEKNRELIDTIVSMENKVRKRNLMVSEEELFLIYKSRLKNIFDLGLLQEYIKKNGEESLLIQQEDLLAGNTDNLNLEQFPDQLSFGNVDVSVEYNFEPGREEDGVTLQVPSREAGNVDAASLDWAIPGLHRDRIAALIKGLPKEYRKRLTPINATVEDIVKNMPHQEDTRLTRALSEYIYTSWGMAVPLDEWNEEALPEHLRIRIAVTDEKGQVIEAARDAEVLYKKYKANIDRSLLKRTRKEWERTGIDSWDLGDLPRELSLKGKDQIVFKVYPVLKDCGEEGVSLILMENREEAGETHRTGLVRLIRGEFVKEVRNFKKELSRTYPFGEGATYFGGAAKVEQMIWERLFWESASNPVWKEEEFRSLVRDLAPRLFNLASFSYEQAARIIQEFLETRMFLSQAEKKRGASGSSYIENRRDDLLEIVPPNFLNIYPSDRIIQLPRYMKLIRIRAEKGNLDPGKDREREALYERYWNRYQKIIEALPEWISQKRKEAVEDMWWYLQEYKIHLFAQEMKTKEKVSTERVEKRLDKLKTML